jgi:hypothetical protein
MRAFGDAAQSLDAFYPMPRGPALFEIKNTLSRDDGRSIGERHDFFLLSTDWGTHLVTIPLPWGRDRDTRVGFNVFVRQDREETVVD